MPDMRGDERGMRRLALGDFPLDYGAQEPGYESGAASKAAARGFLPEPTREGIRRKFSDEQQAEQFYLLRQREVMEGSNLNAQWHPIHDTPFFGVPITFSSGIFTVAPATVDGVTSIAIFPGTLLVPPRHVAFIRSIMVQTFDAAADADVNVSVRVNGVRNQGTMRVAPSSFMAFRQNSYYRIMQNQGIDVLVGNASAILPHDVRVTANGWFYPMADVKETSRGVIPRTT